jgi:hypothetical protein
VIECGQRVAYGTERGVYLQALHGGIPVKYLDLPNVQQIDILEEYHLLIVLSGESHIPYWRLSCLFLLDYKEETVFTCLLDVPGTESPIAYKVALHVSFFKIGSCLGRTLICIVGASTSEGTAIRIKEVYGTMHGIGMLVFKESRREELSAFNVSLAQLLCVIFLQTSAQGAPHTHWSPFTSLPGDPVMCRMYRGFRNAQLQYVGSLSSVGPYGSIT